MICIIRIAGETGLDYKIKESLDRLRIRKKYSCVVIEKPNDVQLGMLKSVADFVAFGEINQETYEKLKKARGKPNNPTFRLHPPRKGIESKKHFGIGKGVLGNNKEHINKLIERMIWNDIQNNSNHSVVRPSVVEREGAVNVNKN